MAHPGKNCSIVIRKATAAAARLDLVEVELHTDWATPYGLAYRDLVVSLSSNAASAPNCFNNDVTSGGGACSTLAADAAPSMRVWFACKGAGGAGTGLLQVVVYNDMLSADYAKITHFVLESFDAKGTREVAFSFGSVPATYSYSVDMKTGAACVRGVRERSICTGHVIYWHTLGHAGLIQQTADVLRWLAFVALPPQASFRPPLAPGGCWPGTDDEDKFA